MFIRSKPASTILAALFLLGGACTPRLKPYAPPLKPPQLFANEKSLSAALRDARPAEALRLAKAHPQFSSLRVRLSVLENLVELGRYEEACALGEKLLNLPSRPPSMKAARKKPSSPKIRPPRKKPPAKKTASRPRPRKEYLTESQRHRVYFNLALAFDGLENRQRARYYFEKTAERPNYYYLYRYAQAEQRAGAFGRALRLFEQSYARSEGHFDYINGAYARALADQAFRLHRENPREAKANLVRILGDKNLAGSPAAARAEILWNQRYR